MQKFNLAEICTPVQKFRQTVMSENKWIKSLWQKCFHEKTWRVLHWSLEEKEQIKTNVKTSPTSKLDRIAKLEFVNQPGMNECRNMCENFRINCQTSMNKSRWRPKCFGGKSVASLWIGKFISKIFVCLKFSSVPIHENLGLVIRETMWWNGSLRSYFGSFW